MRNILAVLVALHLVFGLKLLKAGEDPESGSAPSGSGRVPTPFRPDASETQAGALMQETAQASGHEPSPASAVAEASSPASPPLERPEPPASMPGTELFSNSNLVGRPVGKDLGESIRTAQARLEAARQWRRQRNDEQARRNLVELMEGDAPAEIKRAALLELGLLAVDQKQYVKAQHIFSQYLQLYPHDPTAPEVLLRQGLLYRQMGANSLAIAKFYAVMTTALNLRLDRLEYYQRIVLQAQSEIADTYYLQGRFEEAADYFKRLLKLESPELNRAFVQFKLIRSLAALGRHEETAAQAAAYIGSHGQTPELAEVRFLLASALKQLGRNRDALREVLVLLDAQQQNAGKNPEHWIYWQQRAGNEIANQLYREGDYLSALEIYLHLATLNRSPAWQLPVWYQIGLVYERLRQPRKAAETYASIVERQKSLTDQEATPSLVALIDMARWRQDHLAWMEKAESGLHALRSRSASPLAEPTPNTAK